MRSSGEPIFSLLTSDDALERLDAFVMGLGERIDEIQEAEGQGDLDSAAKGAAALLADARALALPPLAEAAQRAAASCRSGDADRAHADIVELTDVIRRVRLGHRITP